jgi:hypothetical protein
VEPPTTSPTRGWEEATSLVTTGGGEGATSPFTTNPGSPDPRAAASERGKLAAVDEDANGITSEPTWTAARGDEEPAAGGPQRGGNSISPTTPFPLTFAELGALAGKLAPLPPGAKAARFPPRRRLAEETICQSTPTKSPSVLCAGRDLGESL